MTETILGILVTLGGGVIGYLLKENFALKKENRFLMVSLLNLATAIEHTDTINDDTTLHKTASEIKAELKKRLEIN